MKIYYATPEGVLTRAYNAPIGALRVYSAEQRKLHGIRAFRIPETYRVTGGSAAMFDAFPAGHPVPPGAEVAE